MRRVVLTGIGTIGPLGSSKEALWEALVGGHSGVGRLAPSIGSAVSGCIGAEARQFKGEIDDFGPLEKEQKKAIRKGLKVMCRECQMGVAAAQSALADAGLNSPLDPDRIGVSFGTDYMLSVPEDLAEGIVECLDGRGQFDFPRWGGSGMTKMSPLWLLKYLPNMPASHVAIYNDLRGPNNSLTMREAAANAALGEAWQIIRRDDADAMLVGATGTRLHPMKLLHAIQQEEVAFGDGDPAAAVRPFDRDRRGMAPGEGAGAVLLEELSAAQGRGAKIYGEIVAAASSSAIGRRLVADRGRAIENVLAAVLRAAGADENDVGHVHAHGLGTRTCDAEEAQAIARVFSARAKPVPVVAAKGHFGHLGAGSGMIELAASLLALEHGRLFPILNYATPDPECPIAAVRNGEVGPGASFINVNVTPHGQASAVMVRRFA